MHMTEQDFSVCVRPWEVMNLEAWKKLFRRGLRELRGNQRGVEGDWGNPKVFARSPSPQPRLCPHEQTQEMGKVLPQMSSSEVKSQRWIKLAHKRQRMIIHRAWRVGGEAKGNLSYGMQCNPVLLSLLNVFCPLLTILLYCLTHIVKCAGFAK